MRKLVVRTLLAVTALSLANCVSPRARKPAAAKDQRIEALIAQMSLEEKLDMLGGTGFGTKPLPRLGIHSIEMVDGPQGIRGPRATAFPSTLAMIATWNPELMRKVSNGIGREVRAIGRNMILGPCVTLYRVPQSGRNFECSSEDPYLNARFAEAYVRGTQDANILSSTKHFVLNNQEVNRKGIDMHIDDRALHELELPAFEAAVRAGSETVMSSYNLVDGVHASESRPLLTTLLKEKMRFDGVVVSDWESTYNGDRAALAGLDLEMPFGDHLNAQLASQVRDGKIPMELIDDKIRRLLGALKKVGALDGPVTGNPADLNSRENQALALRAADEAIVLLKNENNLLPLDLKKINSIAVVGPGANARRIHAGGSGEVSTVERYTNFLQGLKKEAGKKVKISYAEGVHPDDQTELVEKIRPDLKAGSVNGFKAEYFDNPSLQGAPILTRQESDIQVWNTASPDPRLKIGHYSARWTGKFLTKVDGPAKFEFFWGFNYRFSIDGKVYREMTERGGDWRQTVEVPHLSAGPHDIKIELVHTVELFKFAFHYYPPKPDRQAALALAKKSDVVIAVVGTSNNQESEANDRGDILMPGDQDQFIRDLVKANPRTIVVVNSGGIVSMRAWRDQVPAIVQAWLAGQEGNHAAARVVLGVVNPSGKLPVTIPRELQDSPSARYYWGQQDHIDYAKVGLLEGYRGYNAGGITPEFPFGHGLSYTRFRFSAPTIEIVSDRATSPRVRVHVEVKNEGPRDGAEVVQLYVSPTHTTPDRPVKELKAFAKLEIPKNESRVATFDLDEGAFRHWDSSSQSWKVDADTFLIRAGSSSEALGNPATVRLSR